MSDEEKENFDGTGATTAVPAPKPTSTGRHSNGNMPDSFPPAQPTPAAPKAAPEPSDRLVGQTIDARYVIEKRIARGGMATVYRARDTRLDRPVALKIMYPHLAESADFVARFRREARAAAKLTHPGVVAVYDQGSAQGSSYLVMELIKGPNLRTYLRSQGCLTVGETLKITKEILQALAAAHRSGLIHRDVKPENVLLPETGQVKVADFGLARAASEVTAATTGSILGTVAYLSPETVSGTAADSRVDVYATGIMIFELLAGVPPFSGDSPIQIAYAHVHEDVPHIKETEPWVPQPVDDLIAKLTTRDPAKRPLNGDAALELVNQTIAELDPNEMELRGDTPPATKPADSDSDQELTPTLSEVPLPGAPGSPSHHKSWWKRRRGRQSESALDSATPSEGATRSKTRGRLIGGIVGAIVLLAAILTWFFMWGPGSFRPMVDVVNQQWPDASKSLTAADVTFERVDVFDDNIPAGNVARTNPAPGKPLGRFQTAKIFVSKGIEMLTMPDLTGKTREEALELVKKARFNTPQISEDFHDTVPEGQISSQDPAPNASVAHNTIVKITVSKGRQPVSMPNLVGKPSQEAQNELTQVGLQPQVTEDFSDSVPKGKVISQSVAPNTTVHRLDQVNLVISKGPEVVAVPNVFGKSEGDARAALESAGFTVNVKRTFGDSKRVLNSNPSAGTQAKVGSTVTITLF
ncbi:Stk1 family PASTA domain-containing Ser/Thr kinase [Mobiluncus sp.]|uniref:Stk1 family PASTA domain-containing Ser/Thr kinase n=1 Tax=Mobiluncus sp. TaxID=47293 RepID=UPI002A913FE9|nr:Stk1 family PASTA domain-containing Ser/Thr kinase [Mobiluncus sp.]MDY6076906.1 Stk1 family PASTA domain-containing Ser/Thr kinase [Mobiluncus sp.]